MIRLEQNKVAENPNSHHITNGMGEKEREHIFFFHSCIEHIVNRS